MGSLQLTSPIYYQFVLSSTDNTTFELINNTYPFLGTPNLMTLSSAEIQADSNIPVIVRFLIQQNYSMLPANSTIVSISRDFPNYRMIFDNKQNSYVTVNALYNFYSNNVQVMSVTSANKNNVIINNNINTNSVSSNTGNIINNTNQQSKPSSTQTTTQISEQPATKI